MIDFRKNLRDVIFYEEDHRYYHTTLKKSLTSVTTILKQYQKPFPKDMAQRKADEYGKDVETLKLWWKMAGVHGRAKGNIVHKYLENHLYGKALEYTVPEYLDKKALDTCLKYAQNFIDESKDFVPIANEIIVYDDDIAGQIDNLSWKDGFYLIDYKNDKEIKYKNPYQNFLGIYDHLEDCNFNKYTLQVNTYKKLFEQRTGEKIKGMYIVWINETNNNYKFIPVPEIEIKHI